MTAPASTCPLCHEPTPRCRCGESDESFTDDQPLSREDIIHEINDRRHDERNEDEMSARDAAVNALIWARAVTLAVINKKENRNVI